MKDIDYKLLSALNLQIVFENDGKLHLEDMRIRPITAVRGVLIKICDSAAEVNETVQQIARDRQLKTF